MTKTTTDEFTAYLEGGILDIAQTELELEYGTGETYNQLLWLAENSSNEAVVTQAVKMREEFRELFDWAKPAADGR